VLVVNPARCSTTEGAIPYEDPSLFVAVVDVVIEDKQIKGKGF
jgi:hypothetical protein